MRIKTILAWGWQLPAPTPDSQGVFSDDSISAMKGTGVEKFEKLPGRSCDDNFVFIHPDPPAPPCDQGPTLQSKRVSWAPSVKDRVRVIAKNTALGAPELTLMGSGKGLLQKHSLSLTRGGGEETEGGSGN